MNQRVTSNLDHFERCPLCGVAQPLLQYRHSITNYVKTPDDATWFGWLTYQCSKCGGPVCVQVFGTRQYVTSVPPTFSQIKATGSYIPKRADLDDSVPPIVGRFLNQAIGSLHAPDGAVMLANSAVDAMLKQRGLKEGSVYKRLGQAVTQGLITNEMREWADKIRIESNNPRHADESAEPVTVEQAKLVVEFAKSLADILFVLPAKAKAQGEEAEALAE